MTYEMQERCSCCGGKFVFDGSTSLVKCPMCGHTNSVAAFENELYLLRTEAAAGEEAGRQLEEARKEKDETQRKLNDTFARFDKLQEQQEINHLMLESIAREYSEETGKQAAMLTLLETLERETGKQGDLISRLMTSMTAGQQSAADKIRTLQELSETLLHTQSDQALQAKAMGEMVSRIYSLQTDAQEKNTLAIDFMQWMQQMKVEERARLDRICASSTVILSGQKELDEKIDRLQGSVRKIQDTIKSFHGRYEQDRLEEMRRLFRQAENLQFDRAYDQAETLYRQIILRFGGDAEVYWRLILCHYCVEYQVNDFGEYVPTILNPDLTAPEEIPLRRDFAWQLSDQSRVDEDQRKNYETALGEIDRILGKYRQIAGREKYDVFISVKQDDNLGNKTLDSETAAGLYEYLTGKGLRVFNSDAFLLPAGEDFEPYIIAALLSARTMIVVGTRPEYLMARWVRNEWERFEWLKRKEAAVSGKSERLLLCLAAGSMQPRDLPRGLNPDQETVIDGPGAYEQLFRMMKKEQKEQEFTARDPAKDRPEKQAGAAAPGTDAASAVLNQMAYQLLNGEYDEVWQTYENMLEEGLYMNYGMIHLYALCAQKHVPDENSLISPDILLEEEELFRIAVRFGRMEDQSLLGDLEKKSRAVRKAQKEKTPESEEETDAAGWYRRGVAARENGDEAEALEFYKKAAEQGHIDAERYVGWAYNNGAGTEKDVQQSFIWYRKAAEAGDAVSQHWTGWFLEKGIGTEKDESGAFYWYEKSAQQGIIESLRNLAYLYLNGSGTEKDEKRAAELYLKAANAGDVTAQGWAGWFYEWGRGIEKDYDEAVRWYQMAAEKGNSAALRNLGRCYFKGRGVQKNAEEAVRLFRDAASAGDSEGQFWLGYCYGTGEGVKQDDEKAAFFFREAAVQGDTDAMNWLGIFCEQGRGVEQNYPEAFRWYQKSADLGHAQARYNLASCYRRGVGTEKNNEKAADWYMKAANQGHVTAQDWLGWCFENGIGVQKNPGEAVLWYQKAAEAGNADAMTNLGHCLLNGTGTDRNEKAAFELFLKASELGSAAGTNWTGWCYERGCGTVRDSYQAAAYYRKAAEKGLAIAQRNIGVCCHNGLGVHQNDAEAFFWYRKAAAQGDASAQFFLGTFYETGTGTAKDPVQAVSCYQRAADQGHAEAQAYLGVCYLKGIGVKENSRLAVSWLQKSAWKDDKVGQYWLGFCYENGKGVAKERNQAVQWYQKSAAQGFKPAQEALKKPKKWHLFG